MSEIPLSRLLTVDCSLDVSVNEYNCLFKFGKKALPLSMPKLRPDLSYRTLFGPSVYFSAITYSTSEVNYNAAIMRWLAPRKDNTYDTMLRDNQAQFLLSPIILELSLILKTRVTGAFIHDYSFHDDIRVNAYASHPRQRDRIQAYNDLENDGRLHVDDYMSLRWKEKCVSGKMKPAEYNSLKKKPRLVCDMTTPASLVAGTVVNRIKTVFEQDIVIDDCRLTFVSSPKCAHLKEAFSRLLFPVYKTEFLYYSDDSCIYFVDLQGKFQRANVDISQCDMSHTPATFAFLQFISSGETLVNSLIEKAIGQMQCPLKVGKSIFTPKQPVMYSGSILTTLLNNIANCFIGLSIHNCKDVVLGAERAGFKVTVDPVNVPEDFQFLKHSPTIDAGEVKVFMNLGTLLRTLGTCRGDLPLYKNLRSKSIPSRAEQFMSCVVSGFQHSGNSRFLHNLILRYGLNIPNHSVWYFSKYLDNPDQIPDLAYQSRYGSDGYAELCDWIREAPLSSQYHSPFTELVFEKDYGYSS